MVSIACHTSTDHLFSTDIVLFNDSKSPNECLTGKAGRSAIER